jgi:hypothetical protein
MNDTQDAIRERYEAYGQAFSAMDPVAAASYWHAPSIRAFPDRVAYTATRADRQADFAATIEDLAETPYDHSEAASLGVYPLSESVAIGNPVWDRFDADGDRLERFSPLHLLRRTEDGWQLTARSTRRSPDGLAFQPVEPDTAGVLGDGPDVWPEPSPDVRSFFADYARAFETLDVAEILPFWHLPTAFLTDEGVRGITSRDEAEAMVEALRADLRPQDYARSEAVAIYAHDLDDSLAIADVLWHRFDDEGERIDRFAALTLLRETADGWTIVVVAPHAPETMVAVRDSA